VALTVQPAKTGPITVETASKTLLDLPLLGLACAFCAALALVAIFLFADRRKQMRYCIAGVLISLLIAGDVAIFPQWFVHNAERDDIMPAPGSWLLFLVPLLFFLAYRYIKKDEELVRSADRLR
jgi:drug/metabolite transporter (DMT)-like permease